MSRNKNLMPRLIVVFVVLLLYVSTLFPLLSHAEGYFVLEEKEVSLTIYRRYIGFYMKLNIVSSDDYGYMLLIFTGEGIFAYGYYVEKKRGEADMILYRVSGDQNEWFYMRKIPFNKPVTLALFIDTKENKVYYRLNNTVVESSLRKNFKLSKFHIIIGNIDRNKRPPYVLARTVIVFESDTLNKNIIYNYTDNELLKLLKNQSIVLLLEGRTLSTTTTTTTTTTATTMTTTTTTTTTTTQTTTPMQRLFSISNYIVLVIIAVIVILLAIIVLTYYTKRSHGP